MAKTLNPADSSFDYSGKTFAVVVSSYNDVITNKLRDGAIETLQQHKVADERIEIVRVPGAWELALAAKQLVASKRYAGVVCLGAVIKGETTHDQHINRFVSMALGELSLEHNLPVAFGLLTCNTFQQAHDRSGGKVGNKGHEATMAMLEMVRLTDITDRL